MIGIAVSRFNEEITEALLRSCLATLTHAGHEDDVVVLRVPGGFELPWAVQELAMKKGCAAVIALGCVLKGSTPQNEHISRSLVQQLHAIMVKTRVPVSLGVITPNTWAQAVQRTKGKYDRGKEAAEAALEMIKLRGTL
jgi:6,7-dimethyl-8-ribityllumazine synthase